MNLNVTIENGLGQNRILVNSESGTTVLLCLDSTNCIFFEILFNIFMSERVISFVKLLRDSLCNQVPTKAPHLESGMKKNLTPVI